MMRIPQTGPLPLESCMTSTVAIIGSGIAGLAAAHRCHEAGLQPTLFEVREGHGMDAQTIRVEGGMVDVPLRIMSRDSWRETLALAGKVGVDSFPVNVYTSCSWADRKTWFRSGRVPLTQWPTVGSWRYVNFRALRLARGLARLSKLTGRLDPSRPEPTLGQVLQQEPLDRLFLRGLIMPMLSTICTCQEEHLLDWPAGQILDLLDRILHQEPLLRLRGGTSALVDGLARDIPCHLGSPVNRVRAIDGAMSVHNEREDGGRFDRVIVATPANQLDFLDPGQFGDEVEVLKGIGYARGELVVHRDERFMPRARRDWTALNFQTDRDLDRSMFTVWVNAVEPSLADAGPVFQTWNPMFEPDEATVLGRFPMQRAVVSPGTAAIHKQLKNWHDQPGRQLFYCGSWAHEGVPLLESAVRSSRAVVDGMVCRESTA